MGFIRVPVTKQFVRDPLKIRGKSQVIVCVTCVTGITNDATLVTNEVTFVTNYTIVVTNDITVVIKDVTVVINDVTVMAVVVDSVVSFFSRKSRLLSRNPVSIEPSQQVEIEIETFGGRVGVEEDGAEVENRLR